MLDLEDCRVASSRRSGRASDAVRIAREKWRTADAGDGQCRRSGCSVASCTVELCAADNGAQLVTQFVKAR